MSASDIIRAAPSVPARPWPRHVLSPQAWQVMADALAHEPGLALIGLWADTEQAHALFLGTDGVPLAASTAIEAGHYAGLSPHRPVAAWFERMVHDLWGHQAAHARDPRPWLDHGHWPQHHPMAIRPTPAGGTPEPPDFLPVDGEGLHQVAVGPIHAGIIEPGHFRFTASGETVVRLEARLGYTHKGTLALMRGKPPAAAARFAARISGDSTVAHSLAFARAVEAACGLDTPPRAQALRVLMLEMERIANHLGDVGAVCGDAAYAPGPAQFHWQREAVLRACAVAFGHRLMMDRVVPGGVAADLDGDSARVIADTLHALHAALPDLARMLDAPGLSDRLRGTGITPPRQAASCAAGGFTGRAAGRGFDARLLDPAYKDLTCTAVLQDGDVDARLRIRLAELAHSTQLVLDWLPALPAGAAIADPPAISGEGFGVCEGFRGDIWHWVRLDAGRVATVFARDPSWCQWPLLEAAMAGSVIGDFPLINKSINGSYSGVDL